MSKFSRYLIYLIRLSLVLLAISLGILCVIDPAYTKYGGVLSSLLFPFLPPVVEKILKIKISFRIQLIYYIFLFVALYLGIDLDFYKTVPQFDKIIHFISGVLSVILGYYVLIFFRAQKTTKAFRACFLICFSMAIAVLWEFFEFSCDKLLGQSMQQLISVGVDDTMFDLLSATLGGVIGTIWIINLKNLDFLNKK